MFYDGFRLSGELLLQDVTDFARPFGASASAEPLSGGRARLAESLSRCVAAQYGLAGRGGDNTLADWVDPAAVDLPPQAGKIPIESLPLRRRLKCRAPRNGVEQHPEALP